MIKPWVHDGYVFVNGIFALHGADGLELMALSMNFMAVGATVFYRTTSKVNQQFICKVMAPLLLWVSHSDGQILIIEN